MVQKIETEAQKEYEATTVVKDNVGWFARKLTIKGTRVVKTEDIRVRGKRSEAIQWASDHIIDLQYKEEGLNG